MSRDRIEEEIKSFYHVDQDEKLVVVVPSLRVSSEEFLENLKNNGIDSRALGVGTGRVVDHEGKRFKVSGVLVGVVSGKAAAQAERIAGICGITMMILD